MMQFRQQDSPKTSERVVETRGAGRDVAGPEPEPMVRAESAIAEYRQWRTPGDLRLAIEVLRSTPEGREWTLEQFAEHFGVALGCVAKVLANCHCDNSPQHSPESKRSERKLWWWWRLALPLLAVAAYFATNVNWKFD